MTNHKAPTSLGVAGCMAFAACAKYGAPEVRFREAKASIVEHSTVFVGSDISVRLQGTTLQVSQTPLCADRSQGTYTIIKEEVRAKTSGSNASSLLLTGLASFAGGLALATYTPEYDSDDPAADDGTDVINGLGVVLVLVGTASLLAAGATAIEPDERRTELPPETEPLQAIAPAHAWKPCGSTVPMRGHIDIAIKGGGNAMSLQQVPVNAGIAQLPRDLAQWANACKTELHIEVTALDGEPFAGSREDVVTLRSSVATIDDDGGLHSEAAIRQLLPAPLRDREIEVGGGISSLRAPPILATDARRHVYQARRAEQSSTATTPSQASDFARACLADQQRRIAEARDRKQHECFAPLRDGAVASCRRSCTANDKVQKCDVQRDICVEQTAGIGGVVAEECENTRRSCLRAAGQDEASLRPCVAECERRSMEQSCRQPSTSPKTAATTPEKPAAPTATALPHARHGYCVTWVQTTQLYATPTLRVTTQEEIAAVAQRVQAALARSGVRGSIAAGTTGDGEQFYYSTPAGSFRCVWRNSERDLVESERMKWVGLTTSSTLLDVSASSDAGASAKPAPRPGRAAAAPIRFVLHAEIDPGPDNNRRCASNVLEIPHPSTWPHFDEVRYVKDRYAAAFTRACASAGFPLRGAVGVSMNDGDKPGDVDWFLNEAKKWSYPFVNIRASDH